MPIRFSRPNGVGALIREARMARGMTKVELAERLGLKYSSYIANLENENCRVSADRIREIAAILKLSREERDQWLAASGHIPDRIRDLLLKHPERWEDVLTLLEGARKSRAARR